MSRARILLIACVALLAAGGAIALTGCGASRSVRPRTPAGHEYAGALMSAGDAYRYDIYVPATYRPGTPAPLIVVLHGCRTTAAQQAAVSGFTPLAQRDGLLVLYPEVDRSDVANGSCWKGIWHAGGEGRGRGDAGAIAAMTRAVMGRWRVDPSRVYAIGISAGGFEASMLGASYPDMYAAIGIHSGAGYRGDISCLVAMRASGAASFARGALAAMGTHARVLPVLVIHGDQDPTVPYHCGVQALAQWLATDNLVLAHAHRAPIADRPASTSARVVHGGHAYTVASYRDATGCPVAQLWTIHGMGHAWSGGTTDPSLALYSDPRGPSAAVAAVGFFLRWRLVEGAGACAGAPIHVGVHTPGRGHAHLNRSLASVLS